MPATQRDPGEALSYDVSLRTTPWTTTGVRGLAFLTGLIGPVAIAIQIGHPLTGLLPVAALVGLLCAVPAMRAYGRVMAFGFAFPAVAFVITMAVFAITGDEVPKYTPLHAN